MYFDPEADKTDAIRYENITSEALTTKLANLLGVDEYILTTTFYMVPLSKWALFDHAFIVFQTSNWFWSIEKHTNGLTIQRSTEEAAVKNKFRQQNRLAGIKLWAEDESDKKVSELLTWLYRSKELKKPYQSLFSDCESFAKAVFNYTAKTMVMAR